MGNKPVEKKKMQSNSQEGNANINVQVLQQNVDQVYQQQQYQQNNYAQNLYQSSQSTALRLLNEKEENKNSKVVAVIVTLCTGGSYDSLFTTVQQKSMEGTKVEVYACDSHYLQSLIEAFEGKPKDDVAIRLMDSIKQVDSDCVVFNWECCGGYGSESFPEGNEKVFKFLRKMMDRGFMCMFSDFSLKALVKNWDEKYELGPNPFAKTGEYSAVFEIRFNNNELKECPSAQLQIVGDMAVQGKCNIHAMGGTIVYCLDSTKLNHKHYKAQVLTVVANIQPPEPKYLSTIGNFSGSAGHILLKYPSGGAIITSMGHWIELMKIDTSEQKLFEVAQKEYGQVECKRMRMQYQQMDMSAQQSYVQSKAQEFVRNQAPCTNMYKKQR